MKRHECINGEQNLSLWRASRMRVDNSVDVVNRGISTRRLVNRSESSMYTEMDFLWGLVLVVDAVLRSLRFAFHNVIFTDVTFFFFSFHFVFYQSSLYSSIIIQFKCPLIQLAVVPGFGKKGRVIRKRKMKKRQSWKDFHVDVVRFSIFNLCSGQFLDHCRV